MPNGTELPLTLVRSANRTPNELLATITASLSIFGTTFIIVSYFVWKDIQSTSRKILVFISIADFFTSIGTIMGVWSNDHTVCIVQATIGTLSVLCSFFWTVFMAVYLYISMTRKLPRVAERLMVVFHLLGWGVPAIIVSIAVATSKLGNNHDVVSSGWCWVDTTMDWDQQLLWMLLAGKGWEMAAYVIITVLYVLVKRNIQKELQIQNDQLLTHSTAVAAQRAERKLIFIPLVFVLLRVWSTVRFFIYISTYPKLPGNQVWLLIMQGIGDSGQGFANFLLFCFFTEKVFNKIRLCYSRICLGQSPVLRGRRSSRPHVRQDVFNVMTASQDSGLGGLNNEGFVNDVTNSKHAQDNKGPQGASFDPHNEPAAGRHVDATVRIN